MKVEVVDPSRTTVKFVDKSHQESSLISSHPSHFSSVSNIDSIQKVLYLVLQVKKFLLFSVNLDVIFSISL